MRALFVLHFVMVEKEKWLFIFAFGVLALSWPMLKVFDRVLPHYLFGVWGLIILAATLLSFVCGRGGKG